MRDADLQAPWVGRAPEVQDAIPGYAIDCGYYLSPDPHTYVMIPCSSCGAKRGDAGHEAGVKLWMLVVYFPNGEKLGFELCERCRGKAMRAESDR